MKMAIDYSKQRIQFGRPIGSFTAIQHSCADMVVYLEGARCITYEAACKICDGDLLAREAHMAKAFASNAYRLVTSNCHQIFGGVGYMVEHDLHLYYRRAKALELALGDVGGGDIPPGATLLMEIEMVDVIEPVVMTEVAEEDYTVTESGLKYYDFVEGTGEPPVAGQIVVVHYTGWLEDGTKFDSSLDRGQPFSFPLGMGNVIPGWDEGVATMKVGGKRQLVVPGELGYGETGAGDLIPPGATLIFEVELLAIQE